MGYLIYKEQYSIEDSEPSNLELLRKVGLDVVYSTSKNDIIDKERNKGLIVELINEMETRERYITLWIDVQKIYKEDDIKGLYLYYKKEERQILWEKTLTLDKAGITGILRLMNAELLGIFNKNNYQNYKEMFENIKIQTLHYQSRYKLYMY